jgi:F0F1-type ATP synthase assembly protein I
MANQSASDSQQRTFNATVIRVAVQVGCLTLVIIFAALIFGLWLDRVLDTRPLFTILFLVGSMPVTWAAVFWSVNRVKQSLQPPMNQSSSPGAKPTTTVLEEEDSDE